MKKTVLGLAFLTFFSCSSVKEMQVFVPKPTLVQFPTNVKRIVIVDKTQGNALTAIEGLLSGEVIGIDKILVQQVISGLTDPFLKNSDIQITKHPDRLKSENMTSTGFGAVMPWLQIEKIATEHNADALLVLEYFDSDFRIRNATSPNNVGAILFQGFAKAKVGVRIYLPKTQNLFYENSFSNSNDFGEVAASPGMLAGKVLTGTNAMKSVSYNLGDYIGKRFVSYRTWEDRVIMKGKTDTTKRAERLILAQDYTGAIATLESTFKTEQDATNRANIAHNLGYCYEVEGDLALSKKWLTESFTSSGNKKTQNYLDIINRRIVDKKILESQNAQ
ncbi:hypothetical protein SAMN05444372_1195 [Flavobacterium micromati]|uniref:Uncharacterized protein n=1 Tax=Flavobacterium micromati TaxID=229205 RepID=A0A1M5QR16_9FLAO|nr:DUF6340 family protein [Flavobacterium micromati]MCL6462593.1 hypothetical protein [Flavobacterium micromati]SHH16537.1 hypothetical protein SAMN05444372_1195 [Flavobacterium micromati]